MTYIVILYDREGKIVDRGYFETKEQAVRSAKYHVKNYPKKYEEYDVVNMEGRE